MDKGQISGELKKGSAELLILSLIEHRPRHGYEIGKLIEARSAGVLRFNGGEARSSAETLLSANRTRRKDAQASTGYVAGIRQRYGADHGGRKCLIGRNTYDPSSLKLNSTLPVKLKSLRS
jgi:hypothetical protein